MSQMHKQDENKAEKIFGKHSCQDALSTVRT